VPCSLIAARPAPRSGWLSAQLQGWRSNRFLRRRAYFLEPSRGTSIGGEGGGFESMTAPITLDPNEGATGVHRYRVDVQMEWFGKNGQTVVGKSLHRVDF
jgi:hypothetical protein